MDYKKHAEDAMGLIKMIEADGPRLPGTPEEKAACIKLENEIQKAGMTPRTEEFVCAPNASLGAVTYLGRAAFVLIVLYYLGAYILAALGYIGIIVFAAMQIYRYTEFWDFAFKKERAKNIITEIQPVSGKVDYTIILGAHYDSSWGWKLPLKNANTAMPKMIWGVLSVFAMAAFSVLQVVLRHVSFGGEALGYVLMYVPIIFLPGFFWLSLFNSYDKTIGSPGAMDNLTGIAINMELMKHFNEHPEQLPENCRLMNIAFACEEASLKGSKNYVKAHKNDPDFKNCYVINLDSIADPDYFEAVRGDAWQGTTFDENLTKLTVECMKEAGIQKPGVIKNPVGGCDSTPFCLEGIPTITIAAQKPTSTQYYHSMYDVSSRFESSTIATGIEVTYRLIGKIGEQRKGSLK